MSSSIVRTSVVSVSQEQVSCELQEEVVILNLGNGEYYGLDPVGARIWSLIQEPRTVGEICDLLLQEYSDVEPDRCEREVVALLEQMGEARLIEVGVAAEG